MEIHVSLIGRRDLSGAIYRQVRQAVLEGKLRPGDPLPPSRELASRLGVSRTTVTLAYDRLAGEGFVESRVGSGTFVGELGARMPDEAGRGQTGRTLQPRPVWGSIHMPRGPGRPIRFDFRSGIPDGALFPHERWRQLIANELRSDAAAVGEYSHPAGHRGLREAIARHIGVSRGVDASPDDVTITNGTQQALDILARVLLGPGDRIAVEDPGYGPPKQLFASLGLRVVGVPVDREGLVVKALPRGIRLVYVTPSHHYPLGVAMALPRRLALLAWADRNNAAIIEDDYDSEFRFGGRPIEPLKALDAAGRVIYVGSFSKTMLPALRLGFLVAPPSLRPAAHRAKFVTDWHSSMLAQGVLARFIDEGGFARHLRKMRSIYHSRHDVMMRSLTQHFGGRLEAIPSAAGLHIAAVARSASAAEIGAGVRRASEAGIPVLNLSDCAIAKTAPRGLVLGYGAIPADQIDEGIRELRRCFD